MFIPRLLIYKKLSAKSGGISGAIAKGISEAVASVPEFMKQNYEQVLRDIDEINSKNVDYQQLKIVNDGIDDLRADMIEKGRADLLPDLQILFRKFMKKLGVTKKGTNGKIQLVNPYENKGRFFKNKPDQFSSFNRGQMEKLEKIMWKASPDMMVSYYIDANIGTWPDTQVSNFLQNLTAAARYHIYLYWGKGVHSKKRLDALRNTIQRVHSTKFRADNKQLAAWLKYNAENYKPSFKLVELGVAYKGVLNDTAISNYISSVGDLKRDVKKLKSNIAFDEWVKNPNKIGTYSNNSIVTKALVDSGLPDNGGLDHPKVRAELYARLLHSIYKEIQANPKISSEKAADLLKKEYKVRRKYGVVITLSSSAQKKEALTPRIKKSKLKGVSETTARTLTKKTGLESLVNELSKLQESLVVSMSEAEYKKFIGIIERLRDLLQKKFGFTSVIRTQEDTENIKKAQALIDYFETFAAAFADSQKLPGYKEQLEEFSELDAENAKKFKKLDADVRETKFSKLETLYLNLKAIKFLPRKKDYKMHSGLLTTSRSIYEKWCSFFKFTPKLTAGYTPYLSEDADPMDEDAQDYVYSPFLDVDTGGSRIDLLPETVTSYEVPPMMTHQMNRLYFLATFAEQFLKSDEGRDFAFSPRLIGGRLTKIQGDLTNYYLRKNVIGDKFDGKTPFNLQAAVNEDEDLRNFVNNVRIFFEKASQGMDYYSATVGYPDGGDEFKATYNYLKASGLDAEEIAQQVQELKYVDSLIRMLDFNQPFNPVDMKQAGHCIASFTRTSLKDFETSRDIWSKVLQPHMPASRRKVLESKRNKDALLRNARTVAAGATFHMVKTMGPKMLVQFKEQVRRDLKKKNGKEPSSELVYFYAQKTYSAWIRDTRETLTDLRFKKELDWMAVSPKYFTAFGKLDETDRRILKDYRDSLGQGKKWHGIDWDAKDETIANLKKIGDFWKEIAIEVALTIASIYIPGAIAIRIGRAAAVTGKAVSATRMGIRVGRMSRVAGTIARLRNAYEMSKWLQYGLMYGGKALKLLGQGSGFLLTYPLLNNALVKVGVKSKKVDTIFQTWTKHGWGQAVLRVMGETAMFASFHGVGFATKFLKYGKLGKVLHAMKLNPKYAKEADYVLQKVGAAKNGKEGWKAVEKLLAEGIPTKTGYRKLSPKIAEMLGGAKNQVGQLRERYFRLIANVDDKGLKSVLGLLVQDLGFDMVAMILGTVVKHQLYKGNQRELNLMNKDTLFQMFTMGLAFRATFVVIPKATAALTKKFGGKSPMEAVELGTLQVARAREQRVAELKPVAASISKWESRYYELQGKIAGMKAGPKKVTAMKQKAKISIKLRKLRTQKAKVEKTNDTRIKSIDNELAKLKQLLKDAPLANYPVPSAIARMLPRPVREHLYKTYRGRDGIFLGSKGFADLCVKDWSAAEVILGNAKRSILSPSEVIHVAAKLSPESRMKFLGHMGRILTPGQAYTYTQFVKGLSPLHPKEYGGLPKDIAKMAIPREVTRRGPRAIRNYRWHKWRRRLTSFFIAGGIFLGAYGMARAKEAPVKGKTPYAAVKKDFRAPEKTVDGMEGGRLHFTPQQLAKRPSASRHTARVVQKAKVTEGSGENGKDSTLLGAPKSEAKALKRELPTFGKTAGQQVKVQHGVLKALAKGNVGKPTLWAMANWFTKCPDPLKPFVLVTASIPKGATGKNLKPDVYIVYNQGAYADYWAKKYGKPASEAPFILDTIAATRSYVNQYDLWKATKKGDVLTGLAWLASESFEVVGGGLFQGNIVSRTIIGPENNLMETGRIEGLKRYAHKNPLRAAYLFMWLTALGIRLGNRARGVKEVGEDKGKRDIAYKKITINKGGSLGFVLNSALWLGKSLVRIHNYPWRNLGIAKVEKSPVIMKGEFPTLAKVIRGSEPLSPKRQSHLESTYNSVVESNLKMLNFKNGGKNKTLEVFKQVVRNRYIELRLKDIRDSKPGTPPLVGERLRQLDAEVKRLVRAYQKNSEAIQDLLLGGKDVFSPKFFSETSDGPKIAAEAISEIFVASKKLSVADKGKFNKSLRKTFQKLAVLQKQNPKMKAKLKELANLDATIKLHETAYKATGKGSAKKIAGKYPLENSGELRDHADFKANPELRAKALDAHAFLTKYEAMLSRQKVLAKEKGLFKAKAKAIVKDQLAKASADPKRRAMLGALGGALAVVLIKMFTSGDNEEYEYGSKRVGVPGDAQTPSEHDKKWKDKFDKKRTKDDLKKNKIKDVDPWSGWGEADAGVSTKPGAKAKPAPRPSSHRAMATDVAKKALLGEPTDKDAGTSTKDATPAMAPPKATKQDIYRLIDSL